MEPDRARFYQLLGALERGVGGCRVMGECTGRLVWPERGVYFFFEPGEVRSDLSTPRVVRVGTHAVSRVPEQRSGPDYAHIGAPTLGVGITERRYFAATWVTH